MTQQPPSFLRLHVEEQAAVRSGGCQAEVAGICQAFSQATGWRLTWVEQGEPRDLEPVWSTILNLTSHQPPGSLCLLPKDDSDEPTPDGVIALAEAYAKSLTELAQTRSALVDREAELAAGVALIEHADEAHHLAARLEAVLNGAAEAVEGVAAALYLLDDATTELKLRACWNLPHDRFVTKGRPLAGAVADLEALTGHAVVIEDVSLLPHWRVPEDFASAACVPVSSPTTPLGTLWVFDDTVRDFLPTQTNMLEITAGRIAADLERELLLSRVSQLSRLEKDWNELKSQSDEQLPQAAPVSDAWEVAARCLRGSRGGSAFFDWFTLPDDRLLVAIGDAEQSGLAAAMTTARIQAAMRSAGESNHQPLALIEAVDQTLQATSSGGQAGSLWLGALAEDSPTVEYCSAGTVGALQLQRENPLSLTQTNRRCGEDGDLDDAAFAPVKITAASDDTILVFNAAVAHAVDVDGLALGESSIADAARGGGSAAEMLDAVVTALLSHTGPSLADDAVILVARRRG